MAESTQSALDAVYTARAGRIFLSGTQALVRLPLVQRWRDAAEGLDTRGYVTGYRGSPLAGYDRELAQQRQRLQQAGIHFQPAINEELAATALLGSQQVSLDPEARQLGVFAIWYGKGPGLDRAGDALKHANSLGSSRHGGGLVVVGDDHGAVSSSMAHQSEQLMASWMMPVLHPASVHEIVELGLLGIAMSRFSGCLTGFKMTSECIETAATVEVDLARPAIVLPDDVALPPDGVHLRWPDPQLAQEARLQQFKLPLAQAFARANRIDRPVLGCTSRPRLGIVAAGKAYLEVLRVLEALGIDDRRAGELGIGLYKVGLVWPLETAGMLEFARGAGELLVVEEKRAFVESQLKEALYALPDRERPPIVGKRQRSGAPLLPSNGELGTTAVARALVGRLGNAQAERALGDWLESLERLQQARRRPPAAVRPPFFCPGCPHSHSIKVPDGSRALAGTGCHLMAAFTDPQTSSLLQMGGEGANWVGMEPFTTRDHMFQNLGDGTYVHSGSLAIRHALAAGSRITYKILYNDAVAMTGGQPIDGGLTVAGLANQLYHEGVRQLAVVSDDPAAIDRAALPPGTSIDGRDALDAVQRRLRDRDGVTVLIYVQPCATELRRRRKRGEVPAAPRRVFINEAVCEGCGDCTVQSRCLALTQVATPLGSKQQVDQAACSQDLACLEGFCPALVTVEAAAGRRTAVPPPPRDAELPAPVPTTLERPFGLLVAGIGGTGIVTVGRLVGMAAHLDGHGAAVLDLTGLAQKGGTVLSHIRLGAEPDAVRSARLNAGSADLLLATDLVVGAHPETLFRIDRARTRVIGSDRVAPTAGQALAPGTAIDRAALAGRLAEAARPGQSFFIDARDLAERLTGDGIGANLLLLGYAFQKGWLPVSLAALQAAIRLNGVGVDTNLASFAWGRLAAHDLPRVRQLAGLDGAADPTGEAPLEQLIESRAGHLARYRDRAYADRYRTRVATVRDAERRLDPDATELTAAAAAGLHLAMAIKDEYEVARLHVDPEFRATLAARFGPSARPHFHFAVPGLPGRTAAGRPRKRHFGPWLLPLLRLLAGLRRLRGTPFDPFGWSAERRREHAFAARYDALVDEVLAGLDAGNYPLAVELLRLPEQVRGFGPVKLAALDAAEAELASLLARFHHPDSTRRAA